jgi:outer membrane protein, multidrug efflux system
MKHLYLVFGLTSILPSCIVGPEYHIPDSSAELGQRFLHSSTKISRAAPRGPWWLTFNDPCLTDLENQVLAGNQQLVQARAKIDASRAIVRQLHAERLPTASLDASISAVSSSNITANGSHINQSAINSYPVLFDLNYEFDIWGRLHRSSQSALAQSDAAILDAENGRLFLTIEAARLYVLHRSIEAEIAFIRTSIQSTKNGLTIVELRKTEGISTSQDVAEQRAILAAATSELINFQRDLDQTHNALAAIVGLPPSKFNLAPTNRDYLISLPSIPTGLPADLLNRRADIAASERRLAASSAEIGIAIASGLPKISLTGQAGSTSSDVGQLFNSASRFGLLNPGISVPFLDGGRSRSNLDTAKALNKEQFAVYQQSILTAVREVEDSLVACRACLQEKVNRKATFDAAEKSLHNTVAQHEAGTTDRFALIEVEKRMLSEHRYLIQAQTHHYYSILQLIKALGGGWRNS